MSETQNIEYKSSWHDDYLKWICGFANAQGGTLYIGKDDNGKVVGVNDSKKLLEDLPNKIRSTMGVVVDVNLRNENKLFFIEITVPAYQNAISYHGKYYLRSGCTNQELSGYALDALLLGKYGRTYDSMPLPNIKIADFWHDAFDIFRKKAVASKRLTVEDVAVSDEELLQFLNLTENNYLLLAAVLIFHQTPQQYCIGSCVKIGYFVDNAEIRYQDEITGALVGMADKVVETIFTKYFIGLIRYEGLQRIDDYPMPRTALREAVMNALVHRDYSTGSPIQIRVYDDHVTIANDCRLPEGTTLSGLMSAHKSLSINPLIANAIFRSGQIEAWGRGIERIIKFCVADNLPEPEFIITPRTFTIYFHIRNHQTNDIGDEYCGISCDDGGVNCDDCDVDCGDGGISCGDGGVNCDDGDVDCGDGGVSCGDCGVNCGYGGVNGGDCGVNCGDGGVNEIQQAILDLIDKNPNISVTKISQEINVSKRTIENNIKQLKNKGLIKRIGSQYFHILNNKTTNIDNENYTKNDDGGVSCSLNEIQQAILDLIDKNPNISVTKIAQEINVSKRTIENNIKQLKAKGLIKRIGSDKTGHWQIIKTQNKTQTS